MSANSNAAEQDAGVKWIDFYYMSKLTDKDSAVLNAKTNAEADQPVGAPELPVFNKELYDETQQWIAEYINVPVDQMKGYTDQIFDQPLRAEPKFSTQEVYALLDPVVQSVLTDPNADIDALLEAAQAQAEEILSQ